MIDSAYILEKHNLTDQAKLAASAAYSLSDKSTLGIAENPFIIKILQKSSLENLLKFQYKLDENIELAKKLLPEDNIEKYKVILNKMYNLWNL